MAFPNGRDLERWFQILNQHKNYNSKPTSRFKSVKPYGAGLKGGARKSLEGEMISGKFQGPMTVVREPPAPMISYMPMLNPAKKSKSKFSAAALQAEELKQAGLRLS